MYLHAVIAHIKGNVRHVQKVIGEVLFDDITLVSTANDEVIDAVVGVAFEYVPQYGFATNFNHGFWAS
jgi:hypothetical protein